ncbi:hypothetical protein LSH36_765g01009, partial [Paralvinella palmiformis]
VSAHYCFQIFAYKEFAWSPHLYGGTGNHDKSNNIQYGYLATATKAGHVIFWKVETSTSASFGYEFLVLGAELLAIAKLWTEKDDIRITHLIWLSKLDIIVASKGTFVIITKLSTQSDTHSAGVKCVSNKLPITAPSVELQELLIQRPYQRLVTNHGLVISPNDMFIVIAESPAQPYCHLRLRDPLKVELKLFLDEITLVIIKRYLSGFVKDFIDMELSTTECQIACLSNTLLRQFGDNTPDVMKVVELLEQRISAEDGSYLPESCPICKSSITDITLFAACCPKGHKFSRCSQTLLLCHDVPYRICAWCETIYIGKLQETESTWLRNVQSDYCVLCDQNLYYCL